ncbi:hypothetical protein ACFX11_026101 [Malus domestica]
MVAEAKVLCQQSVPVLDVEDFAKNAHEVEDVVAVTPLISSPKSFDRNRASEPVSAAALLSSQADVKPVDKIPDLVPASGDQQFFPRLRSGSFADIGPRRYMEDEHILIDDLSSHLGSLSNK